MARRSLEIFLFAWLGCVSACGEADDEPSADAAVDAAAPDAGWPVPPEPPPGPICFDNFDCAATEYCHLPFGRCYGLGSCQPRPASCESFPGGPVCTCDGTTETSACAADLAGRSIAYPGACGARCGGRADCPTDQVCRGYGQHEGGRSGTCGALPTDCGLVNRICRSDTRGYAINECDAARYDVALGSRGPCGVCLGSHQCNLGAWYPDERDVCVRPIGQCGERLLGTCLAIRDRDQCLWHIDDGNPVCTCDGQTLPAECEAEWLGVRIDHVGACDAAQ